MSKTILTGIKPTGEPHLGNFLGAIQPALELARNHESDDKYFFIADYHALTTLKDPALMAQYRQIIAATWLSFFREEKKCYFYFQSDISEIFELYWILSCFCPKGLLNRAHAYKALVSQNNENNHDNDRNINQGVFSYPVLMAADILLFKATHIPIGPDQKQHVEIAIEIVKSLNKYLKEPIPIPKPIIDDSIELVIGTDGQKMSKNYNNTIPIFSDEKALKKILGKVQTDSTPLGQPLNPDACNVYKLLQYVTPTDRLKEIKNEYKSGSIGYGHAKQYLLAQYQEHFKHAQNNFFNLIENTSLIHERMAESTQQVQLVAKQQLAYIKSSLGF